MKVIKSKLILLKRRVITRVVVKTVVQEITSKITSKFLILEEKKMHTVGEYYMRIENSKCFD